ncbi:hypothetical protein H4R27_004026, partial [Coemansia aciculifera]
VVIEDSYNDNDLTCEDSGESSTDLDADSDSNSDSDREIEPMSDVELTGAAEANHMNFDDDNVAAESAAFGSGVEGQ